MKMKSLAIGSATTLIGALTAVPAFAAVGPGVANTAVSDGFGQAAADITATISSIAPYALGLMVLFLAWKYGRRFFNQVGK